MANNPVQFPFLQLSEPVSQRILKSMSLIELFDLSLTSSRVRKQVKQRFANNFSITISWRVNPQFRVNLPNDSYHSVGIWKFYHSRSFTRSRLTNPTTRLINGRKVQFCKVGGIGLGCPTADTPADEIINVFEYLVDLFNGKVSLFVFAVDEIEELLSKETGGFEKFWTFKKCKELKVWNGRVSHEEMKSILDLGNVVEKLELSANPDPGFVLEEEKEKPISFKFLQVRADNWITRDVLFSLNCQTAQFSSTALTNEDINAFLHNWMNSTDKRLQCLFIRINSYDGYGNYIREGEELYTLEKVVHDLETIPGSPKPSILARLMNWDEEPRCENGVDLKRDDQVVATALVETCEPEEGGGTSFLFVVW